MAPTNRCEKFVPVRNDVEQAKKETGGMKHIHQLALEMLANLKAKADIHSEGDADIEDSRHSDGMEEKKPTTGTPCLPSQGGKREALCVPAECGQRVGGGKHGSGVSLGGRSLLGHLFERHGPSREVPNSDQVLDRDSVVSHLRDAPRRQVKVGGKSGVSPALCFKPRFQVHGRRV